MNFQLLQSESGDSQSRLRQSFAIRKKTRLEERRRDPLFVGTPTMREHENTRPVRVDRYRTVSTVWRSRFLGVRNPVAQDAQAEMFTFGTYKGRAGVRNSTHFGRSSIELAPAMSHHGRDWTNNVGRWHSKTLKHDSCNSA